MTTPIDLQELRNTFAWIAERVRRGHEGLQPIAGSTALKAISYFDECEAQRQSCTCGASAPGFEINTARCDAGPYRSMEMARIDRIIEADREAGEWMGVR